ncbi:uncharacterized protein LOC142985166 [Anticarsia gemmatalis]|uniref:uncharacterized protein LOC142985166 n=1 Tax=Anticarsia gemmatalis TaxID=129554 RepID=UPI003F7630A3
MEEHSRLLKFIIERHKSPKMSDQPESPAITAEVPASQTIRESTDLADYSPVITVTKEERTLTKGGVTQHKITVTEDVSVQETENGGHRVSYVERQTSVQTTNTSHTMSDGKEELDKEEKSHHEKKSRIPQLKFKQTVEKVKKERKDEKIKEQQQNSPRRSSIPKLKDAKLVKKDSFKEKLDPEQLDDEFDKIYEEIVDNKTKDIDIKSLIQVEDPEKIETKFEEIIHAYDSDDLLTNTEKLRLSKIPWRKKDKNSSTTIERVKRQNSAANLKDGGFRVSTITTKRFSRGNSVDTGTQKVDTETNGSKIDVTNNSLNKTRRRRRYSREISTEDASSEEGRPNRKTGIPVKSDRINRSISRELNKRPPKLDDRDMVNREVVKYEEITDGNTKTVIKETVSELPVRSEKMIRGISRTFSRDGKSVTVTSKTKEINKEQNLNKNIPNETVSTTTVDQNNVTKQQSTQKIDENNIKETPVIIKTNNTEKSNIEVEENATKPETKTEILQTEEVSKHTVKVGIPVYTKTTHSYSKGKIQNVEISKTIEWQAADEIIMKQNNPIENKVFDDRKFGPTVVKNLNNNDLPKNEKGIKKIDTVTINNVNIDKNNENIPSVVVKDSIIEQETNKLEASNNNEPQSVSGTKDTTPPVSNKDRDIENTTVLKGNVSRLKRMISEKEQADVKKEIDVEEDLPKKKSVLSKIAMFEGKEPAEFSIKIKKYTIERRPNILTKEKAKIKPKIVDHVLKTQPKIDPKDTSNKDDNSITVVNKIVDETQANMNSNAYDNKDENTTAVVTQEPIIVDQIWKKEVIEEMVEHQIESIKSMPEAINYIITETSPGKVDLNTNEIEAEIPQTIPEKIDNNNESKYEAIRPLPGFVDAVNNDVELPQILPVKLNFEVEEIKQNEAVILPAKIDFVHENQVIYSPEKIITNDYDSQIENKKRPVGKLDLNSWIKQVEINKKIVNSNKITENQTSEEKINITPAKHVFEKDVENKVLPNKVEHLKVDTHMEIPTILPGRITFTPNNTPEIYPSHIEFVRKESQLQVPVVLPETPLTKPRKLDFETQKSRIEVPVMPGEIGLNIAGNKVETPTALPEKVDYIVEVPETPKILPKVNNYEITEVETPIALPEIINFDANQAEINTNLPEATNFKHEELKVETTQLSPEKDFENKLSPAPNKLYLNPFERATQNKSIFEVVKPLPVLKPDFKNDFYDSDRGLPSDPELVDSEPEIKESKENIMRKLKNKIYFIAKKNRSKKENNPEIDSHFVKDTIHNIEQNHSYIQSDYSTDFKYKNDNNYRDFDSKSDIDVVRPREDIKRAKSLAELDLGDVVKGQVQRMVYRMKSMDFEKHDTPRSSISIKEMPKKSSVLEKILLFEGKASSNRTEKPEKYDRTERFETTTLSYDNTTLYETTTRSPEEIYLQKIEELSAAKVRYGKTDMLYLQLANGVQMPAIALGTALMDTRLAPHIVSAAIDLGYRAIDTAYIYGNERVVGQAIKAKIDDGTVKREDLFIMSKLWSTFHRTDLVEAACRASLEALGLEYFDLYMIHNPISFKEGGDPIPKIATVLQFSDHDYLDAWYGMEALVSKGLARNIGVSNFNSQQIQRILDKGKIRPVVNQVECHPYLSQQRLQAFCSERNITLSCYGALGAKGTPAEFKSGVPAAIDDPLIKVMASGLNVTAAQLLVRYQMDSGRNVVVKASSAAHLWDILQAVTFELQPLQVDALNALNRNKRIYTFKGMGDTHKNYPFHAAY